MCSAVERGKEEAGIGVEMETEELITAEETDPERDLEDCRECRLAVGAGMYLNVCEELKDTDIDCKDLHEKLLASEITLHELYTAIKDRADDDQLEILSHIDGMIGENIEDLQGKTLKDIIAEEDNKNG